MTGAGGIEPTGDAEVVQVEADHTGADGEGAGEVGAGDDVADFGAQERGQGVGLGGPLPGTAAVCGGAGAGRGCVADAERAGGFGGVEGGGVLGDEPVDVGLVGGEGIAGAEDLVPVEGDGADFGEGWCAAPRSVGGAGGEQVGDKDGDLLRSGVLGASGGV